MSVASKIQDIKNAKEVTRQALYVKGCHIPTTAKLSEYEGYITDMQVGIEGIDVQSSDYFISLIDKYFIFNNDNNVVSEGGNVWLSTSGAGTYSATNLSPENIKKGVSILGKTGTYSDGVTGVTQDSLGYVYIDNLADDSAKSIICQASENQNYQLTASGTISLTYHGGTVTATNLAPENIKKGVSILGKTGTYDNDTLKALLDCTKRTSYLFYYTSAITDATPYFLYNTTDNVTNMSNMYYRCSNLTTVPLFNTSKVTTMNSMFYICPKLTEVPAFDVSNVTNMEGMFTGCTSLTAIHCVNINANLDISASTLFTTDSFFEIFDTGLKQQESGVTKTLTIGSTNLAKLDSEYIALAASKGWTLA